MQAASLAVAADPMKPGEYITIPGVLPPMCPNHRGAGLQVVKRNDKGDLLFECLASGDYMAVYRMNGTFECPPVGVAAEVIRQSWRPPFFGDDVEKQIVEPTPITKKPTIVRKPVTVEAKGGHDTPVTPEPRDSEAVTATDPLMTLVDAAALCGVKPTTILAAAREGKLKVTDGKVRESDLMDYAAGRAGK